MSFNTYLKLTGSEQGLISAGCSSFDSIGNRHQNDHDDEIQILSLNHAITREQHCTHHPVEFIKPIDKLSPLMAIAISNNEILTPSFSIYRLNQFGALEKFYEIKLTKATIIDIS
ncbi:type VI secretion system tube protein TssD [Yersinia pseudotuberculosis]|uniref:type VI secretion system tube protein TssD n=1 Tax=Yersinia pseudotuberculosis TaxID=633 RepID=UPI0038B62138